MYCVAVKSKSQQQAVLSSAERSDQTRQRQARQGRGGGALIKDWQRLEVFRRLPTRTRGGGGGGGPFPLARTKGKCFRGGRARDEGGKGGGG